MSTSNSLSIPNIECEVLVRELGIVTLKQVVKEYMVANGMNMGRWTSHFGVHCLADTPDCRGYIKNRQEEFPGSEILKVKVIQNG